VSKPMIRTCDDSLCFQCDCSVEIAGMILCTKCNKPCGSPQENTIFPKPMVMDEVSIEYLRLLRGD